MTPNRFVLALSVLCLLNAEMWAQQISSFSMNSIFTNETLFFGSAAQAPPENTLVLGNISLPAPFENLRQFYVGGVRGWETGNQGHALGVTAINQSRGELLSETSLKLLYQLETKVGENMTLVAGTHVGFYQMALEGTPKTDGGADAGLNLDLGFGVRSERFEASIAMNNITQPELNLISQGQVFHRSFEFFLGALLTEDELYEVKLYSRSKYADATLDFIAGLRNVYRDRFLFGVHAGNRSGSVYLGLTNLDLFGINSMIGVGYQVPMQAAVLTQYTPFQIHLQIWGKRNKAENSL